MLPWGREHKEVWVVLCAALGPSAWGLGLPKISMEAVAAWSSMEPSRRLLCSCLFSWTSMVDIVQARVVCQGLNSRRGCFWRFVLGNSVTSCMSCGLSIVNSLRQMLASTVFRAEMAGRVYSAWCIPYSWPILSHRVTQDSKNTIDQKRSGYAWKLPEGSCRIQGGVLKEQRPKLWRQLTGVPWPDWPTFAVGRYFNNNRMIFDWQHINAYRHVIIYTMVMSFWISCFFFQKPLEFATHIL